MSIGHKDSDNLIRANQIRANNQVGVFFRNESLGMAGHRNRIEDNIIEDNGNSDSGAGIRIRGETRDLIIKDNLIRDTRPETEQTQTTGIQIEEKVGAVVLEGNLIRARAEIDDRRPGSSRSTADQR